MQQSNYVFDVRPDTFDRMVLENSRKGPVMVFYWSPDAGPCKLLLPRLVKLCDEAGGRFLLTLLNTAEFTGFARRQGVASIPTVKIYSNETAVETIHGAWSEAEFGRVIGKYVAARRGAVHAAALAASQAGDDDVAIELLGASTRRGANWRERLDAIKLLIRNRRFEESLALIEAARAERHGRADVARLLTHLEMISVAGAAPPLDALRASRAAAPGDAAQTYRLAAVELVNDNRDEAKRLLATLVDHQDDEFASRARRALAAIDGPTGEQASDRTA